MIKSIFFIVSTALLLSCSSNKDEEKYKEELIVIDAKLSELDAITKKFIAIDSTKAMGLQDAYNENIGIIKKYYGKDMVEVNLDETMARSVTHYKALKNANGYKKYRKKYLKEVDYTVKQLNDLKEDIKTGALESEEVQEYVELELKGFDMISKTLNDYTNQLSAQIAIYDSLNPFVENIVDSLLQIYEPENH